MTIVERLKIMTIIERRKELHREYEKTINEIWRNYERDMHKAWMEYLEKKEKINK